METLIFQIEIIAQKWFEFMVASSVQLGLFLVLIFIITSIFRNQSARFLYLVWLIGLLKIFIPPTIKLPAFISNSKFIMDNQIPALLIPEIHITTASTPALSYQGYLFIAWAAVVLSLMYYWLFQLIQFRIKVTRSCIEITDDQSLFDKQILNDDKARIFTGTGISMPFTKGLIKPKIYLPESTLSWQVHELKALILHEYAHIKRRDILFITLQNMMQLLFFFHPLVWLANRQISRYREQACDDFAIQALQGKALEYGKLLLKSIDDAFDWKPIPSMSNYFHQSKKFLLNRFHYILNRKENIMIRLNLSQKLVLVGLMVVGIAISCQKKEQSSEPQQVILQDDVVIDLSKATLQTGLVDSQKVDDDTPPPPPSPRDEDVIFVAYDKPPQPIGGFAAIQQNLVYPEIARRAGIEGTVIVHAQIGVNGEVVNTRILKSLGENNGCDEAAVAAIKAVKWQPAKAKGQPVSVWVSIPVKFKLSGDSPIEADKIADNIEELKARMKEMPLPPPPPEGSEEYFVPYDNPPQPIGDFDAIQNNLVYPELAKKAGIDGIVVVMAQISENGDVLKTKILRSLGENNGCDDAAIEAIKSVKWKPARVDGKPVAVWVSVPVKFNLQ
jgi:TonB family protein